MLTTRSPTTKENRIYNSVTQASKTAPIKIERELFLEERLTFYAILGETIIFRVRSVTYSTPDAR